MKHLKDAGIQELVVEFEKLQGEKFLLAMKDRWSSRDFDLDREMFNRLLKIQEELNKSGVAVTLD